MSLKITAFIALAVGLVLFMIGLSHGGAIVWIGFAFLVVSGLLALWIKWGPSGWGWESRRRHGR